MARTSAKNAHKVKTSEARSGCPRIRLPWEREAVGISFDPERGRTHQSFKDECDIENIINLHTRTGMVTHLNPGTPQYGDNPESTLLEAAVAQAEIRSALEEGWEPPADELEDSDPESVPDPVEDPEASQAVSETKMVDSAAD